VSVRLSGDPLDARTFKADRGPPLDPSERGAFADAIAPRLNALSALETPPAPRMARAAPRH
jgi:hypothetical protein